MNNNVNRDWKNQEKFIVNPIVVGRAIEGALKKEEMETKESL